MHFSSGHYQSVRPKLPATEGQIGASLSRQPAHASNVVNETVANGAETVLEASALSAPIFESTKN